MTVHAPQVILIQDHALNPWPERISGTNNNSSDSYIFLPKIKKSHQRTSFGGCEEYGRWVGIGNLNPFCNLSALRAPSLY
jgi:hypothetical protein